MVEHVYLKEILSRMSFVAIWKPSVNNPRKVLHNIYSKFTLLYFSVFIITQIIQIYFLKDGNELMENLALTLLYVTTLGKIIVSKSDKIRILVEDILHFERIIFENGETTEKNIYAKHVDYYHKLNVFLTVVGVATTFPFFIRPIVEMYFTQQEVVPLPLSSWFPFDKNEHYYISYTMQVVAVTYAATSIVLTDGFFLGLMIFVTGRIRILQLKLKGMKHHTNSDTVLQTLFVRKCCIEHQNIIRYVKDLDKSMNLLMLLDFAICSVQIAITAFWLIVTEISMQLVVVLIYFTAMLIQMFLFYWFASEMTYESIQISSAVWDSDWYGFNESTKRMLLMIMLRAQKPLTLSVGPFYTMSNQTALMILKAAYSYVAVLSKVYTHEKYI